MHALRQALAISALVVAAALAIARPGMAADADKAVERTVSVSATGSVSAVPDIATISAGVLTEADTARDALSRNNTIMAKLIDGLKAAGIASQGIQTITLNVEPRYVQAKDGRPSTVSGYRVANRVRITVRDIKKLGDVLDQAITLGANQINSIAFEVSTAETLKDDARKLAMDNARRRAQLYATAAGVQLGPVVRIAENALEDRPIQVLGMVGRQKSVPVEVGTQTLEVEVHVTYALR